VSESAPHTNTIGKLALVTGASQGLGSALATFLAGQGTDLLLTARHAGGLGVTVARLSALGVNVRSVAGDVSDPAHRGRLAEIVRERGSLDLLVNNASDLGATPLPALADYPLERLVALYRTNVVAPLGLLQLLRPFLAKVHGSVVNISSDAAIAGYPGWGGYGSSKAALDLMTRTLANELRPEGITVLSVDPGDMRTAMHQAAFPDEDISDRPLPEATLPFWAWLFGQSPARISGHRFRAQEERWEVPA
jgi:NAD(P)-dependent dehydrogenase (short-subunit alcohol dehydrogenase family)